jgi:hypothetical protein
MGGILLADGRYVPTPSISAGENSATRRPPHRQVRSRELRRRAGTASRPQVVSTVAETDPLIPADLFFGTDRGFCHRRVVLIALVRLIVWVGMVHFPTKTHQPELGIVIGSIVVAASHLYTLLKATKA